MNRLVLLILFFVPVGLTSQILPDRYREEVFAAVVETQEVLFSTSVPVPEPGGGFYEWLTGYPLNVEEYNTFDQDLFMDVFEPEGDTIQKRPLVIICFGGGFLAGSKDHWSIRLIAEKLAKRGYVTATIDYRLGMNIFDADLSMRAPYRGLQDGRSAVRYFKADADGPNNFKIDTNNIYIGGHSAGAFIALHNAYMNTESERPVSTYSWSQDGHDVPDQLCLDCVGDNTTYNGNARAVFSLAGALGFTDYIQESTDPQVVMFHSEDDDTVPYHSGQPFGSLLVLVVGSDLPDVYGSQAIAERGDEVGLTYQFNSYTNRGHSVHEETGSTLYPDIIPKLSDSFYVHFLEPEFHPIEGDSIVCDDLLTRDYQTTSAGAYYYDWQVTGGIINNPDIYSSMVTVQWDPESANHKLVLAPYSIQGARGKKDSLVVQLFDSATNTWNAQSGNWDDVSNWSLNHSPNVCEDVFFKNQANPITIELNTGDIQKYRSIEIGVNTEIVQHTGTKVEILTGGRFELRGNYKLSDDLFISYPQNGSDKTVIIEGDLQILGNGRYLIDP